ncbi:MAG TPA: serine/threonine-protein kinase [Solirubrobacteraceae bacterium]|nr:serine/threonine-protein kinase [Solirubrobacteraceae bacterium]
MRASQARTARRTDALRVRAPEVEPSAARTEATAEIGGATRVKAQDAGPLVLERYRLIRRLGAGGFGTVWSAHDERLERDVAVKIVPRGHVNGGRFEREARAAARLSHPGIVTLYEAGADDEGAYLVSELIKGQTFDDLLEAGRLSDRDIVAAGIALCDALSHAHANGVVHRDVKPSNVLVPDHPSASAQPVKLTDFGVARVLGGDSLTRTGDVVGTAAYMAPEQAEGLDASAPADLYSLALVLYEALTGVNPIRTGSAAQRARRLGAHLPPLRRQRRDLPRELGRGIDLALRPKPRERGTIEEFQRSLQASLRELSDEPGIVADAWRPAPLRERSVAEGQSERAEPEPEREEGAEDQRRPLPWTERGLGALAAALATGWLAVHAVGTSLLAPPVVALLAAVVVAAMPRLGWLAIMGSLTVAALATAHTGSALVLIPLAVIPILLLPRSGASWPLAAGAPALGIIGLAGAWPALAARARTPLRRAGLGAAGWVALVLAAPFTGSGLYLKLPAGTPGPAVWTGSAYDTLHHVLGPVLSAGVLAPAPVWAIAAVVLPVLVTGRRLVFDAIRVVIWAAMLLAMTSTMLVVVGAPAALATPSGAVLGAAAAAAVALAPTALRSWHASRRASY